MGTGSAGAALLASKREALTLPRSRRRRHVVGRGSKPVPTEAMSSGPQTSSRERSVEASNVN
jgi:hypothetical protein